MTVLAQNFNFFPNMVSYLIQSLIWTVPEEINTPL